ncbi:MAG TPA: glycosyltransferase family 2 protein, partial [Solirubrobacterales bacterium]|nr:glycosyltransferase family 2 protein [Solirubrobacterales bacterium]
MTAPTLTVVTPSFNHAGYLERTIASVLEQDYPALEFVIVDGGSDDGSVEIIRAHEQHLAWWVSERDDGQADAINKAIERTRGEIIAYINSDDHYMPGAFARAVAALERSGAGWVAGGSLDLFDGDPPTDLGVWQPAPPAASERRLRGRHWWVLAPWHVPQPSCFWRREMFEHHGLFRRDLANTFDAEFMLRLALAGEEPELLPDDVLAVRLGHPGQKSGDRGRSRAEIRRFGELFASELDPRERRMLRLLAPPVAAWRAFRETLLDPGLRFGGRLLERVPASLRPR